MRFVLVDVTNVLGLHGSIDFVGNPTLLYGRNLAGKTNLINLIRYCFVSRKAGKTYTEEKRLSKDELLLNQAKDGRASIYFQHKNLLYRLEYLFKRSSKAVNQKVYLHEAKVFPKLADKIGDSLKGAQWTLLASNINQMKEKFGEVGIFSDVIDVLISPSNVRNFADAINDKLVTIPDIIAKRISDVNKGAAKLIDNLQKLQQSVLVQEKETYSAKLSRLMHEFGIQSSTGEEEFAATFVLGLAFKNLNERLKASQTELSGLPSEEIQLELLKQKWAPQFKDRLTRIKDAKTIFQEEGEAVKQKEILSAVGQSLDVMKALQASLKNLPTRENIVALLDFKTPSIKSINLEVLLNRQRIQDIFGALEIGKMNLKDASELAKKYKVGLRLSEVSSLASSYKQLVKALKSPKNRPKGDQAIITYSKEDKQSLVSIPISTLVKSPDYLKGIESTPSVYRTATLTGKRLEVVMRQITDKMEDLEKCRVRLKAALQANETAKKLFPSVSDEMRYLDTRASDADKKLRTLLSAWEKRLASLCEAFGIQLFQYSLDTVEGIGNFTSSFRPVLKIAESNLTTDLKKTLGSLGVELTSEMDIDKITIDDLLKKESAELLEKKAKLERMRDWINSNLSEVKGTEDRLVTIRFLEAAVLVLSTVLEKVREHTSYEAMAEQIAQSIENNVKNCVQMILPEEMLAFRHVGQGNFMVQTLTGEQVTHPAGSHKAVISLGIMLTLSQLFDLPVILDEATDRFDYVTLRNTFQFVNMLAKTPTGPQICFVSYKTLNIEKNQEIVNTIKDWNMYLLERQSKLEKDIIKVVDISQILSA